VCQVWPIFSRDTIISPWRDVRFEEDHGIGFFLNERSLVRGCVCQVLCLEEVIIIIIIIIIMFEVVGRGKGGVSDFIEEKRWFSSKVY